MTALVASPVSGQLVEAAEYMPALTIGKAVERYNAIVDFVQKVMVSGRDFGAIPGTDKPTLLKPGAEKLCTLFGFEIEEPKMLEVCEDWTGKDHGGEPFFYYRIGQTLKRNGRAIATQFASTNSWEAKYRYRWVNACDVPPHLDKSRLLKRGGMVSEFSFGIEKAETTGKYGKPSEYWQAFKDGIANGTARKFRKKTSGGKEFDAWEIETTVYRVPNEDVFSQINTLQKMAQKRALIAATLLATNASEFFTQDVEDMHTIDAEYEEVKPAPKQQPAPAHKPANGNGHAAAPKPPELSLEDQDLVNNWQGDIDAITEPDDLNMAVNEYKKLPDGPAKKVIQTRLWHRGKEAGMQFSKPNGVWFRPQTDAPSQRPSDSLPLEVGAGEDSGPYEEGR